METNLFIIVCSLIVGTIASIIVTLINHFEGGENFWIIQVPIIYGISLGGAGLVILLRFLYYL